MLLAQISDLHLRPKGLAADRVAETNMMAERALRAVGRLRPPADAVLLSGDLTDAGLRPAYEVLVELIARYLRCPVYVIPGNHDRRENFRAALTHLPGVTEDPEFVQYVVDLPGIRLMMLDTVVAGAGHGALGEQRRAWFEARLAETPEKPVIVVMHHPPFDCGIRHMDRIKLEDAEEFAHLIARHPQVTRILCGHVHRAVTARVAHAVASIAPSAVGHQVALDLDPTGPAAFIMEPAAFEVHNVSADGAVVSHIAYVEDFPGPFPFLLPAEYPGA